jgi:hypothetical protein
MRALQNTAKFGLFGIIAGFIAIAASAQTASAAQVYYPAYYPYQTYTQTYPAYPVTYTANATNVQALINQINALLVQLRQLQELQARLGYSYGYGPYDYSYTHVSGHDYDVEVDTDDSYDISGDEATLSGDIDLGDASYATVWFEYGQDGSLTEESDDERVSDDGSFDIDVNDLDEDERYYYRAVAEDPGGNVSYGSIESFVSDQGQDNHDDNNDNNDEPNAETEDAEHITDNSAELHGSVDMNDFEDGTVFFVYGQDESAVEDVEDEDSYNAIDEDGDDLQKMKVYSGLDDSRSFWSSIYNLDNDTDYYFRICVGYDDDGDTLSCGDVESFTTDN